MLPKISNIFRLAKEADLRFTPAGLAVCNLYLVASEKYKDKESQLWISATAFGKTAEFIATVQKGQRVFCSGKIQTESWEKEGQNQSKISMIIDSFDYIEKRDNEPQQPAQQNNQQAQNAAPQQHDQHHSGQAQGQAQQRHQPHKIQSL